MNKAAAMRTIEKVLAMASAGETLVSLAGGPEATTRVADNVITQNVYKETVRLSITCAYGKSHGTASTSDISDRGLRSVVARAQAIASLSPPDPEYMPLLPAGETRKYLKINAYAKRTADLDPKTKARALASAAGKIRTLKMRLSGAFNTSTWFIAVGNSAGLRAYDRQSFADAHLTVLGRTGSGWAQKLSYDAADIDLARIAAEAAQTARKSENPGGVEAGKYSVIMSPAAVGDLLEFVFYLLSAKAADEGRSFLRGKLGKRIFGRNINIWTDPSDPRCPRMPFHGDGMGRRTIDWFRNGVVANLNYSRFWARKKRKKPTGWPCNIIMEGGASSVEDMISETKLGLLISRFWYIRYVDEMIPSVTGMTRDGLFLIRDGKIVKPVRQMRFNENMVSVLNRVESLGEPRLAGETGMTCVPPLKVRDFNFTSTTKF